MKFGADAGTETTKYFGDTLSIKSGTLTDTSFVGDNLKTEVKDNNIIIGMKDTPTFKNITLNRDPNTQIGDNDILTKAETQEIATNAAKSSIEVINGKNTVAVKGEKNGVVTYAVNVDETAIKNAVASDLDKMADKDLGNISSEGKEQIGNIAKSAVKVEGDGDKITVSSTTDNTTGSLTYKVKFNDNFNQTVANKVDVQDFNNYAKSVDSRFDKVDDDIKGTAALAAAMSALSPLDYDPMERTQIMAGVGYYKDNTGLALGVAHHKNNDLMIRGAVAYNHKANTMFNAGISYRFGHKGDIVELNDKDALIVLKRRVQEQNSQLVSQSKQLEQQKEQLAEQNKQIQELTALVQGLLKK